MFIFPHTGCILRCTSGIEHMQKSLTPGFLQIVRTISAHDPYDPSKIDPARTSQPRGPPRLSANDPSKIDPAGITLRRGPKRMLRDHSMRNFPRRRYKDGKDSYYSVDLNGAIPLVHKQKECCCIIQDFSKFLLYCMIQLHTAINTAGVDSCMIWRVCVEKARNITLVAMVTHTSSPCILACKRSHSSDLGTGKQFPCEFQIYRRHLIYVCFTLLFIYWTKWYYLGVIMHVYWMINLTPLCSHTIQKTLMLWVPALSDMNPNHQYFLVLHEQIGDN